MLNPTTGSPNRSSATSAVNPSQDTGGEHRTPPGLRKGERRCTTCGHVGHVSTGEAGNRLYGDVAPIIVDRLCSGEPIPTVQLAWRDGSDRPYTVTVPERYVPAWGCRDRAACRTAAVDPRTALLS